MISVMPESWDWSRWNSTELTVLCVENTPGASAICGTNNAVVAAQGAGKVSKNTTKQHHKLSNTGPSSF